MANKENFHHLVLIRFLLITNHHGLDNHLTRSHHQVQITESLHNIEQILIIEVIVTITETLKINLMLINHYHIKLKYKINKVLMELVYLTDSMGKDQIQESNKNKHNQTKRKIKYSKNRCR